MTRVIVTKKEEPVECDLTRASQMIGVQKHILSQQLLITGKYETKYFVVRLAESN